MWSAQKRERAAFLESICAENFASELQTNVIGIKFVPHEKLGRSGGPGAASRSSAG